MSILESFKNYLISQKPLPSTVTIKNYLGDVRKFIAWFEDNFQEAFTPQDVTAEMIQEYKQISLKSFSAVSVERQFSALRKFFQFLKETQQVETNPLHDIKIANQQSEDTWHLRLFKNYLYINNSSDLTIKNYIIDVKQFLLWAKEVSKNQLYGNDENLFDLITDELIANYRERLSSESIYSVASINRKFSSLKKFLTWAYEQGYIGSTNKLDASVKTEEIDKKIDLEKILSQKQEEIIKESIITETSVRPKEYSRIPPVRVMQKIIVLYSLLTDRFIITPLARLLVLFSRMLWHSHGKQIFSKKEIAFIEKKPTFFGKFSNISGSDSASTAVKYSFTNLPFYKKIFYHIGHTRPKWFIRYQKSTIAFYFNFVIIFILCTIIGVGLYNALFQKSRPSLASAPTAPPRILSFQGRLTDASDNPITAATDLRFTIYNDVSASGSALLWQEADYRVTPDANGIFSLILGNVTSIPQSIFAQNATLYLGITVGTTAELTPRQQLATVPYATNAEVLQGLPPTTDASVTNNQNVVLALNSSGVLSVAGSANTTFQSLGGQFTLTGKTLTLNTAAGFNTNIQLAPDGTGLVDVQKPLTNTTLNNNIRSAGGSSTAAGAVEVDKMFAVLATSSGQSAFTVNQDGAGPIISASHSGVAQFTVDGSGNVTAAGNVTGGTIFAGNGTTYFINNGTSNLNALTLAGNLTLSGNVASNIIPNANNTYDLGSGTNQWRNLYAQNIITTATSGSNGFWQLNNKILSPYNSTFDLTIGGSATGSAFQVFAGANGSIPAGTASSSGNLSFSGASTAHKVDLLDNGTFGFFNSVGGNAGETATPALFIATNGNIGIGSNTPSQNLEVNGPIRVKSGYFSGTPSNWPGTDSSVVRVLRSGSAGSYPFNNGGNLILQSQDTGGLRDIVFATGNPSAVRMIVSGGGNVGIGTTSPNSLLDIQATQYTTSVASISGATGKATLVLDQSGVGDLFTASESGGTRFTIGKDGTLTDAKYITAGGVFFANSSGNFVQTAAGTGSQCLLGGATPAWGSCSAAVSTNFWQLNSTVLSPYNTTLDLAVGGSATSSAKFQVFGLAGAQPAGTASTSGDLTFTGATSGINLLNNASLGFYNSVGGDGGIGATPALFIANNGNIGHGTANPIATLDVRGNSYNTPVASFSGATGMTTLLLDQSGGINGGDIFAASSSGLNRFVISQAGNVGIGSASATQKLDVAGSINVSDNIIKNAILVSASDSAQYTTTTVSPNWTAVKTWTFTYTGDRVVKRVSLTGDIKNSTTQNSIFAVGMDANCNRTLTVTGGNPNTSTAFVLGISNSDAAFELSHLGYTGNITLYTCMHVSGASTATIRNEKMEVVVEPIKAPLVRAVQADATLHTTTSTGPVVVTTWVVPVTGDRIIRGLNLTMDVKNATNGNSTQVEFGSDNLCFNTFNLNYDEAVVGSSNAFQTIHLSAVNPNNMGTLGLNGNVLLYTCMLTSSGTTASIQNQTLEVLYSTGASEILNIPQISSTNPLTIASDVAEYIPTKGNVQAGDIVGIDSTSATTVSPAATAYASTLAGVIGTKSNIINSTKNGDHPLALAGRVPVKVVSMNGSIHNGDFITSSNLSGIGMKATKPGFIVGRALESFDTTASTCTQASSVDAIIWPGDDGTNPAKPCFAVPASSLSSTVKSQYGLQDGDTLYVGKVMLLLNMTYADPGIIITSSGELSLGSHETPPAVIQTQPLATVLNSNPLNANSNISASSSANIISQITQLNATVDQLSKQVASISAQSLNALLAIPLDMIQAETISTKILLATTATIEHSLFTTLEATTANIALLNTQKIVSPLAEFNTIHTNLISPLGSDKAIAIKLDSNKILITKDASSAAVVTIDNNGNASFSGQVKSNELAVNSDATISGTLHAGKIVADEIVGLDAKVSTLAAQNITNVTNIYYATPSGTGSPNAHANDLLAGSTGSSSVPNVSGIKYQVSSTDNNQGSSSGILDTQYLIPDTQLASYSAYLAYVPHLQATTAEFDQGLMSFGPTSLSDTSITGQLAIDGQLILSNNSINVLGSDLQIQPLHQGGIAFEGGQVKIDTDGNLTVNGNSLFNGTLAAKIISPIADNDLLIKLGDHKAGDVSIPQSQFKIHNASNSAVFAINQLGDIIASGAATISKLNLNIIAPAQAVSEREVIATSSAGTTIINQNQREITIDTPLVTENSLIYITPVGTTNEPQQAPYLSRQVPHKSFTVGISQPTDIPIQFNWLIIN